MKKLLFTILFVFLCAALFTACDHEAGTLPGASGSAPPSVPVTENMLLLNKSEIVFETPDLTEKLTASFNDESADVSWEIADKYVASITDKGEITALAGGSTRVTARLKSDTTKTAGCTITVSEPNHQVTSDPFDLKTLSGEDLYVIMCGDSIMRDYGASATDQCGLGQVMKYFFTSNVKVDNSISNGGRSSRMFWNESGRWDKVQEILKQNTAAGKKTLVFFSFGHNDQRSLSGSDATNPPSWTFASENPNGTVAGTHLDYMERYIVETRKLGGVPVCLTPFVRASFSGGVVDANGRHDWSNKTAAGDTKPRGNYPAAMKAAAEKQNAILVDMTSLSAEWAAKINARGKIKYGYISTDNTHETTLGALRLAEMVTENLKKQGYLTNYITSPDARLMINSSSLAFGRLYPNGSKTLSFKFSSFNVTRGTITFTAPEAFGISLTEDGTYTESLTVECTENLIGEEIFVKFIPTEVKEYNGNLTVSHTSVTPDFGNTPAGTISGNELKIALTGAGKAKVEGGNATRVLWPMLNSSNAYNSVASVTPEGEVGAANVKLVGLESTTSQKRGTGKDGDYMGRVVIEGGSWPVNDAGAALKNIEIDGSTYNVYMEYAIPVTGVDFTVNKISMDVGSSGTGKMKWSIWYSTDAEFTNPTPIGPIPDGVSSNGEWKSIDTGSEDLGLTIADGQTLYIRVYPVMMSTKEETGRMFMISDVCVEGLTN